MLICSLNAGMLYYHQWNSDYWLPVTEKGKWRYGAVNQMIKMNRHAQANDLGYDNYTDLPPDLKTNVDSYISVKYPPETIASIENRNNFLEYVTIFGMWQFPLAILATIISSIALFSADKKLFILIIPSVIISLFLLLDSIHRGYFSSLGW